MKEKYKAPPLDDATLASLIYLSGCQIIFDANPARKGGEVEVAEATAALAAAEPVERAQAMLKAACDGKAKVGLSEGIVCGQALTRLEEMGLKIRGKAK